MDEYIERITEILMGVKPIPQTHISENLRFYIPDIPIKFYSPSKIWFNEHAIGSVLLILLADADSPGLFRHIMSLTKTISKLEFWLTYHDDTCLVPEFFEYVFYDNNGEITWFDGGIDTLMYDTGKMPGDFGFIEIGTEGDTKEFVYYNLPGGP